jgi:transcriptional regulator with XRE-family HTH domain|nr:helix-turn-helix transcriptional regulator [uncultured Rhodopila sp.]
MPVKEPSAVRRTLAYNVRFHRERLGLSQARLGEMCDMTQKRIWEIETPTEKSVTLSTITIVAERLGVSEVQLLTPISRVT